MRCLTMKVRPYSSLSVLLFLATWLNITFTAKGISFQSGKSNLSQTFQDWSCGNGCLPNLHCRLPRCHNIAFPEPFSKSGKIQVHVSLSHGEEFSRVHSPSAMWVQSVTTRGFRVCTRETGVGTNGTGVVNWLALERHPKIIQGTVAIDGVWTTQKKCNKVSFKQSFSGRPSVFVSAKYTRDTKPDDAMWVWLKNVNSLGFEVCVQEFLPFDGQHQDTIVDWFAFLGNGSDFNFTLAGKAVFPNSGAPTVDNDYGFCQQVDFNTTFYSSPDVLVSVHHYNNRQANQHIAQENNIITAWVEEVDLTSMRICVKDMKGTESQHDPLSVSYVVIGDLNPCLDVHCPSFGVCKTYGAHDARCVCYKDCPSYQDPVCTANGTTYDNKCWHQLNYCRGLENNLVYHPGSCEGFPIARDRVKMEVPKWSDSSCKTVAFPPYRFYPDKKVYVQISLSHFYLNDSETVHDAVTTWTEDVNTINFTVCAMQAGRNTKNFNPYATVDWMAYQGAPSEGMAGAVKIQKWWSGTKCADVTFPKDKFKEDPVVLVTSEHLRTGKEYDAAFLWTEDATKDSFKVCLREMQNFDGKHEDIHVNWMAFSKLHKPLFTEHGFIKFPNTNPPKDEDNNAYCEFVHFARIYNITPSVLISVNHRTTESGNSAPVHNGITTWIENMNTSGFRGCVKELYETRYDPVSVGYAVLTVFPQISILTMDTIEALGDKGRHTFCIFADICDPGWSYFNGYCYFTSETCTNWSTALSKCRQENSVLVNIDNNEENVFIQHRHNGDKSWLGLNDISVEGNFTWVDKGDGNFTAWAKNQPNNYREEDCVHALGVKYNYEWNDVQCSDCHQYTCKKDVDECHTSQIECGQYAHCTNTEGSYECRCKAGYQGDGFNCRSLTLGLYSRDPAHSCKEIRDLGASRKDGKYWIDPEKNGNPLNVYCDMTTDGGGWLLVSDVVVGSSSRRFNFPIETSYRGVSNSQKFLTKTAMNQLRIHLSFTQLRFFCRKQRTFHVTTANNSAGEAVVQYFSGQTDTMPASCGSYVRMNDDDSLLAGLCSRWGWDGGYYVGKWGHRQDQDRLYSHPAFVAYLYHFLITPGNTRWECDDYNVGVSPGNFWKVFVR